MAQRWEYKDVPVGSAAAPPIVALANEEGRHGWELAAVVPDPHTAGQVNLIFKRPVSA
jgi:hypothetical protein